MNELYVKAVEVGCNPEWHDGIFGKQWHCGCSDLKHACDQQSSAITMKSLERSITG